MFTPSVNRTQAHYDTTNNTASTSARPTNNRAPEPLSPAKMEQALNEWAKGAGPGENRIEAKRLILDAYTSGATYLNLKGLGLKTLPADIGNLTALTELYLYNNQLTTLPADIGKLTALTWLGLSGNQLTTLPQEIWNLTALTGLDLAENQLTTLPADIGNLTALSELGLRNNQLTTLPADIGNLTALTVLTLNNNQLTTLPQEIWNLTALTGLYLYNNKLTTLPADIGNLTKLTELHLYNNQLTTLPKEIGNLTELTVLDLTENQLTTLPADIGNLTELTALGLDNNPLTTLPADIGNLTALTGLSLDNNPLTSLPITLKTFWETKLLRAYDEDANPKTCLERFGALPYIEEPAPMRVDLTPEPPTLNLPADYVQTLMQLLPQHIGDGKLALVPNGERIHTSAVLPAELLNQTNCHTFFVNFERAMHYLHAKHMAHANEYSNVSPASWSKAADLVLKQVPLLNGLGNVFGVLSQQHQESVHANKGQRFLAVFHTPQVFAEAISHAGVELTMRLQQVLVTDPSTLLKKQKSLLKRLDKTCEDLLRTLNLKPQDVFAGSPEQRLAKQMAVLSAKVLIKNPPVDLNATHPAYSKQIGLYLVNQVLGHQTDVPQQDGASTSAVNAPKAKSPELDPKKLQHVMENISRLKKEVSDLKKKTENLENRNELFPTLKTAQVKTHEGLLTVNHLGEVELSGSSKSSKSSESSTSMYVELKANLHKTEEIRKKVIDHGVQLSKTEVSDTLELGFTLGPFTQLVAQYLDSFKVGVVDTKNGKTKVLLKGHNPLRMLKKGGALEKWVDLSEALKEAHGKSSDYFCAKVDLSKLVEKMPERFARTVSMRLPENWTRFARLTPKAS
jgi:Leucine-rich repeat (LRR) protein